MKTKILNYSKRSFALLGILVILVATVFTGCGFVPGAGTNESDNNMCYVKNKVAYANVDNGTQSEPTTFDFIIAGKSSHVLINEKYKVSVLSIGGFLHNIAKLMYYSCFGTEPDGSETDTTGVYKDLQALSKLQLSPIVLLKSVNTKSREILTKNKSVIETLCNICKSVVGGILIIIWSIGFINSVIQERFSPETLLKSFMQLLCGLMLIWNAMKITSAFLLIGDELFAKFSVSENNGVLLKLTSTVSETVKTQFFKNANEISFISLGLGPVGWTIGTIWFDFKSLFAVLYLLLPFIACFNCAKTIITQGITRILEMILFIALSPIPIAMSAQSGFSQDAIRFLKTLTAVSIQLVLMYVAVASFGAIQEVVFTVVLGTDVAHAHMLIISLATWISFTMLSSFLNQTEHLAHDIVGR